MTKSPTSNFILKTSIWWSYKIFLCPILHMKTGLFPVCRKYPTSENTTKFDHIDTLAYNPTRLDFFDYFWYKYLVVLVIFGKKILQQCFTNSTLLKNFVLPYQSLPLHFRTTKTIKKQYSQKKCRGGRFKLGDGSGQRCENQGYAVRWEGGLSFSRVKKPQVTSNHLHFFFTDGHPQLFFFFFVITMRGTTKISKNPLW